MTIIDPFEQTVEDKIIYSPEWAMQFMYKGDLTDVAWCEVRPAENPDDDFTGYAVRIRVNGQKVDPYHNTDAFDVASVLRRSEVRKELSDERKDDSLFDNDFVFKEDIADAAEKLYHRALKGEFVGQLNGTMIYVQEVATVLDVSIRQVLDAVTEILEPEQRISLNGMILTAWYSKEPIRKSLEERTGHKDLSVSGFGWWSCAACGKRGDDYESPSEYECLPVSSADSEEAS